MTAPLALTRQAALARYAKLRYPGEPTSAEQRAELDHRDLAAFEQLLAEAGQPLAWAEPAAPAAEEPPEPDSEAQHWEAAAMAWKEASASWKRLVERGDAERQLLQQRINALLGELAERTRERDGWSAASVRLEAQRDAARQQAEELRRRCTQSANVVFGVMAQRSAVSDALTLERWREMLVEVARALRVLGEPRRV